MESKWRARISRRRAIGTLLAGLGGFAAKPLLLHPAHADEPPGDDPQPYRLHVGGVASDGPAPPPPPPPPPPDLYDAPAVFYTGDTTRNRIYLTMDDCWSNSLVSTAMDAAESRGVRLTFFPVGAAVERNPEFWRTVHERGHGIENHTWDHAYLSRLNPEQIRSELTMQADIVESATGVRPRFMRPPAGDGIFNNDPRLPAIATELGFKIAMWSSDSRGWAVQPRTDQAAVSNVKANVFSSFGPGTIALQHALAADVLALPDIIDEALRRGYECLPLHRGIR